MCLRFSHCGRFFTSFTGSCHAKLASARFFIFLCAVPYRLSLNRALHSAFLEAMKVAYMGTEHAPRIAASRPEDNHLLASLEPDSMARLRPHLKYVDLSLGEVLYEPGVEMHHVFFPLDCIISLLYVTYEGESAEISVVGNEGILGVSLFMGGESTSSRAVVQSAGAAYSLPREVLKEEFGRHGGMMELLLHYTQALITQMSQTAVCNRHHSVDQQLCRWLLLSLDRLPGNRLLMTQELISNMLGVRREGVTEAAGKLQKLGVITYSRGKIEVLDRPQLERLSCECYAVVKRESDRLLHYTPGKR